MRSRQTAAVRWSVGIVVGGIVLLSYQQAISTMVRDGTVDTARAAWQISFSLQTTLIWLLCPALAANAVTQEKEQQTWEMLVFSLLTPMQILSGKLVVRLLPIVGLLVAFAPFNLICAMMGGVTIGDLVLCYLVFAVWIAFLTTVSLFMSWAFKKTASAVALSYLVLFALVIGTGLVEMTIAGATRDFDSPVIWLNPIRIASALLIAEDYRAGRVILLSSMTFVSITVFLYWRMVKQFRAFSVD